MKYARKCNVTGEGMNEGWVWGEGEFYTSTLDITLSECRKDRDFILNLIINDELGCELYELDTVQTEDDLTELKNAIERAKKNIETDEDLLCIGYHIGYLYYTEWYEEEDIQYKEINGVLTLI
tara:strand:+ start:138 stop:506 length:369 start_codon:yes stop_codon:yes gene_type:complete